MALFGSKKSRSEKMLEDVDEYIRTANELLKKGDIEGANTSFRRGRILLQKFDTSDLPLETANRYTRIAYGIMETGDDEVAMECADRALELNEKEIDAYLVKGAIYLKRTRMYNQAILTFNDALKINPRHEKALELKAGALEKRKQYKKAYMLYKQLAEISDNPEKYQTKMDAIKKRMKLKRAGERSGEEKKDVKISMKGPPGTKKVIMPEEQAEEPKMEVKAEKEVIAPAPEKTVAEVEEITAEAEEIPAPETELPATEEPTGEEPKVEDVLNDVLEIVGAPEATAKEMTEPTVGEVITETIEEVATEVPEETPAVEEAPPPEPETEEITAEPEMEEIPAQEQGMPAETEMVAEAPEIPEAEVEGVEAASETESMAPEPEVAEEPEEAEEEAVEIDVEEVRKEANAAFEDDDYEKAEELYEQLAVAGENDIDLYYNLGVCYYSNGRLEDAVEVFDAILDADPDDTDSWLTKGAAHFALKQYDKAIDSFNNVLKRNAGEDAAWYYKACSEALRGNTKLALIFLERAISMDENYREIAADDESFASVKEEPKFKELVGQA